MLGKSKSPSQRWDRGGGGEEGRSKGVPQFSWKLSCPSSHADLCIDMTALIERTLDRRDEESRSYTIVSHRITGLLSTLCNEFLGGNTVFANVNVNVTRWEGFMSKYSSRLDLGFHFFLCT